MRRDVAKEIRSLAPAWLACLAAVVAAAMLGSRASHYAIPTYILATASLGALSIGHEYSHRTLTLLLSQPARRERLLLIKLGVLAPMQLTLYAVAVAVGFRDVQLPESEKLALGLVPVLSGLFVAPALTMLCRNALAGAIFTSSPPGILMTATQALSVLAYGRVATTDVKVAVVWRGMLVLCAFGAVMSWRMFMRLEAIDGVPAVKLPRWFGRWRAVDRPASLSTRRDPIWLLVKKELRLQRMAFALTAFIVLVWLALVAVRPLVGDMSDVLEALIFCCGLLISMVIGSLASAEERHLGTLEWQVLLPVAIAKQWAVKVGTVLSLSLLIALGLSALRTFVIPAADPAVVPFAAGVVLLSASSLYVSSLCTSPMTALLILVPLMLAVMLAVNTVVEALALSGLMVAGGALWLDLAIVAAIVFVVLWFGLANHRSVERAAARVWTQVILLGVGLTTGAILLTAMRS